MLRQGHVSLGFKVPVLGGCPEVRSSEPAVGTYPHNRFHDQTPCPCVPTRPVVDLQRPLISVSLSDPHSIVTELARPPASSRHPQTYRCTCFTCKPVPELTGPMVSKYIRTPACSHVKPRGGFRSPGGQGIHRPRRLGGWVGCCCGSFVSFQFTLFTLFTAKREAPLIVHPPRCFTPPSSSFVCSGLLISSSSSSSSSSSPPSVSLRKHTLFPCPLVGARARAPWCPDRPCVLPWLSGTSSLTVAGVHCLSPFAGSPGHLVQEPLRRGWEMLFTGSKASESPAE